MTKTLLAAGILALGAVILFACQGTGAEPPLTKASGPLTFTLKGIDGSDQPFSQFQGKVVLLVNSASKCGFTKQYAGLQKLYTTYQERGLVVVGIPANDFMGQEPGSETEIQAFCQKNYGVTFPLMAKVSTKGEQQHPLFTYLTRESPFPGAISWNFNKFLIGRNGQVIARWGSRTAPDDAELITAVETALAAAAHSTGSEETKK